MYRYVCIQYIYIYFFPMGKLGGDFQPAMLLYCSNGSIPMFSVRKLVNIPLTVATWTCWFERR